MIGCVSGGLQVSPLSHQLAKQIKKKEKKWQNLMMGRKGENGGYNKEICLPNHFNFSDYQSYIC